MLTGITLKETVDALTAQGKTRSEIAIACGYCTVEGNNTKVLFTAFYEAIMDAKGITTAAVAEQQEEVIAEDTNNQETINELLEDYPAAAIEEFIEYFGEENIDSFTDAYQGQMSGAEFAEQLTTDCYCLDIPAFVSIDWEATWNELSHDYVDLGGYIFCLNF